MSDLNELKAHVRWLEDEVSQATAVDECLDLIDGRLEAIGDILGKHAVQLERLADAYSRLVDSFNRAGEIINGHGDVLRKLVEALTAPTPQPSSFADVFGAAFKPGEPRQPAAKPKPRKPKFSVVPTKDGDEGPGAAP